MTIIPTADISKTPCGSADGEAKRVLVHLTSSRLFGGPERQMLGLAEAIHADCTTRFISFSENGLCRSFLEKTRLAGYGAVELEHDTPRLPASYRDLMRQLKTSPLDVLFCHGYKANILGLLAGRRLGIQVVSISRGWTGESSRVRLYEALDRRVLRYMDHVVCVAEAQARKVRRVGVPAEKVSVIHNAIDSERFAESDVAARGELEAMFPDPPKLIVGSAGRLSSEKGFDILISAARQVIDMGLDVGFILFGDGVLRETLADRIDSLGLERRFVLAGFRSDLDRFMPSFDIFVQSSHTEGLPNVLLEAAAAGVPAVATNVGGTSEVIIDGLSGFLVSPADTNALASGINRLLMDNRLRCTMGTAAKKRICHEFSFDTQSHKYLQLICNLAGMVPESE